MNQPNPLLFNLEESGATDYRNSLERDFLECLSLRSQAGKWFGDGTARSDRTIVTVCIPYEGRNVVRVTLRVDFLDSSVVCGFDETQQLVTNLNEHSPETKVFYGGSATTMADFAADWIEEQLAQQL